MVDIVYWIGINRALMVVDFVDDHPGFESKGIRGTWSRHIGILPGSTVGLVALQAVSHPSGVGHSALARSEKEDILIERNEAQFTGREGPKLSGIQGFLRQAETIQAETGKLQGQRSSVGNLHEKVSGTCR